MPVPEPTKNPQRTVICHGVRICEVNATPRLRNDQREANCPPKTKSLHYRDRKRTDHSEEKDVHRYGSADGGCRPTKLVFKGNEEDAWRGPDSCT